MASFLKSKWAVTLTLAVFLPSFLLMILLRIVELVRLNAPVKMVGASLASDVLVFVGACVFSLALLHGFQRRPKWVVGFSSILFLLMNLSEVISANFFLTTGSVLDFAVLVYGVEEIVTNWHVISSETPAWVLALTASVISGTLAGPWVVAWVATKKGLQPWFGDERRLRISSLLLNLGIGLAFLGALPPMATKKATFASSSPAHLVGTAAKETIQTIRDGANSTLAYVPPTRVTLKDPTKAPNIVFVLMESTRASATSLYGDREGTTPNLEKLAKRGILAEKAFAVVPHTSKALVATLCGFEPFLSMRIAESVQGIPGDCLPKLLGSVGYKTAFFQSATRKFENRQGLLNAMGYQTFFPLEKLDKTGFKKVNYFGVEDLVMLDPSEEWLKTLKPESPFLLTYLTVASHHNYLAPRMRYGRQSFEKPGLFNRYLNAVYSVDAFVGDLVEMLKTRGLWENTILVVLGDHGEAFNEHGRSQHDNVMYQEGVHIPLLIVDGRNDKPKKIPYGVNQLDILPTVLGMAGIGLRGGRYSGADMRELEGERPRFAHCWYEKSCLASMNGHHKYIHYFDAQPDEYYDLSQDPDEKKNIADQLSEKESKRLVDELLQWRKLSLRRYETFYKKQKQQQKQKQKQQKKQKKKQKQ